MKLKAIVGIVALLAVLLAVAPRAAAQATPVFSGAIWVDGELWGTILTPAILPDQAPASSFDILYSFEGSGLMGQRAVADSAPGDVDHNGGRWMVFAVAFTDLGKAVHDPDEDGMVNFELMSEEEVLAHAALGHIVISEEPVLFFECPLVPTQ
jgi:hypothetical protein